MNQKRKAGAVAAHGNEVSPLSVESRTVAAEALSFDAISEASLQGYLRMSFPKVNVTTANRALSAVLRASPANTTCLEARIKYEAEYSLSP